MNTNGCLITGGGCSLIQRSKKEMIIPGPCSFVKLSLNMRKNAACILIIRFLTQAEIVNIIS